ncbi:hypothetical protein Tco_1525870 [Tanacetum coccineum]
MNRRLHRRNRRVPFEQRNEPPAQPKVVYALILDINYFRYFLDIFENYNPIDDEPIWAANCVVTLTPGSAITIPETANEFAIKDTMNEVVRLMMFPLSLMGEAKTWLNELNEGTIKTCEDEDEESTPQPKSQTPKRVKETLIPKPYKPKIPYPRRLRKEKMEAQCRKFLNMIRVIRINVPLVDVLAGMPNYRKFLKELVNNKHKLEQISSAFLRDENSAMIQNKYSTKIWRPRNIDVIDEILEEDFYDLLDEGSKILYSIERTILEEKLFAEFDEFMAMTADENSKSNSDTEEPPFEKITFGTDYKIKTSLEEPPSNLG